MASERLEIIRLSESGEVQRRITCLSGRVSVFRSRSEETHQVYEDALIGRTTGARFSILLDGQVFVPTEHSFIGFGEAPLTEAAGTIGEYLAEAGLDFASSEQLLLSFGLGGLRPALCSDLSDEQQRILRLLRAFQTNGDVVLLNDPFFGLAKVWVEKLGEYVGESTWSQKRIVIVPRLGVRPDSWLENEYISRIPLEPPRERTIGFGGGDFGSQDLVGAIRAGVMQFDKEAREKNRSQAAEPEKQNAGKRRVRRPTGKLTGMPEAQVSAVPMMALGLKKKLPLIQKKHLVMTGLGAMLALVLSLRPDRWFHSSPSTPGNIPAENLQAKHHPPLPDSVAIVPEFPVSNPRPSTPSMMKARSNATLEAYPVEIREAVLKAFQDPRSQTPSASSLNKSAIERKEVTAPKTSVEPTVPDYTQTNPSAGAPLYEPNTIMDPEDPNQAELEAQRELLRRHFLEAVARARDRQAQLDSESPGPQ